MDEKVLKLEQVTIDNALNPREGALDQEAVLEYSQAIEELPPMHVFRVVDQGYLLVSGFHRIAAHRLAGAEEGRFIVHQGTRAEAQEFADLDNLKHGLRLSRREKRQVIARYLKRHPERSDVWVAKDCRSTDKTARSVREELEQRSEIPRLDTLVDVNGIERPRSVPRPPAPAEPGPDVKPDLPGISDVTWSEDGTMATVEVTDGDVAGGMAKLMGAEAPAGNLASSIEPDPPECEFCGDSGICSTCQGSGLDPDDKRKYCPDCGDGATGECRHCIERTLGGDLGGDPDPNGDLDSNGETNAQLDALAERTTEASAVPQPQPEPEPPAPRPAPPPPMVSEAPWQINITIRPGGQAIITIIHGVEPLATVASTRPEVGAEVARLVARYCRPEPEPGDGKVLFVN